MAEKIRSFTDLKVWQEAHHLALGIYKITKEFPNHERFSLSNQLQRAGVSISSNIAEGFSRGTPKGKVQFYYIALGSLTEVQNQLLIAKDLGYIAKEIFTETAKQTIATSKLINGLIKKLKTINS